LGENDEITEFRAALYVRTATQHPQYSTDTQSDNIRDYASKHGIEIVKTYTDEGIPRQWKVIQTVREKFTCRDCEKISQPPAPFHPTPRAARQSR
jgi:hypothetical protein